MLEIAKIRNPKQQISTSKIRNKCVAHTPIMLRNSDLGIAKLVGKGRNPKKLKITILKSNGVVTLENNGIKGLKTLGQV